MLDPKLLPPPTLEPLLLDVPAPSHVPRHLIRDLRFAMGGIPNTELEPYYATERLLRDDVPAVMWSPLPFTHLTTGHWVVKSHAHCSRVYQDVDLFSTEGAAQFQLLAGETFPSIPLGIDAPDHGKYRRFLNPWFTPRAVAELSPDIHAMCDEIIDDFLAKGAGDFAWDFARVFPVRVFLKLMGFPFQMFQQFLDWEHEILHSRDFSRMGAACTGIIGYLREFIAEKMRDPDTSLTSKIVNGTIDGESLTADERIGIIFFLWLGGLDTVASTLSQMFRRLSVDHDLQQTLRDNPSLIKNAVEEFLRMQPLVNSTRKLKKDTDEFGVAMKAGDHVMALTSVANFDPATFGCPRHFNPERKAVRHFTLASGPHICLCAHLARQELIIALEQWLSRVPKFSVSAGENPLVVPGLMSVRNLPITW